MNNEIYVAMKNITYAVIVVAFLANIVLICLLKNCIMQFLKKERVFKTNGYKDFIKLIVPLLIIFTTYYYLSNSVYSYLTVYLERYNGHLLNKHIKVMIFLAFSACILFYLYFLFANFFPKSDEKLIFFLVILSIISGFGNAIIIFIINESLNRISNNTNKGDFILYFVLGILIYICNQKLVRTKLVTNTNNIIFSKRIALINKVLKARYEDIEKIEKEKLYSGLNNDTEIVSSFSDVIVTGATNMVTLLCCFAYLGIVYFYGFLVSVLIILITVGLYYFAGQRANKLWQKTRDMQNEFFRYINEMISGLKELNLNSTKCDEFKQDILNSCDTYRGYRVKGEMTFTNVFIMGELLFIIFLGIVVFIFPIIFKDLNFDMLRTYVLVFMYMTGSVRAILNTVPNIMTIKISWQRLNELIEQVSSMNTDQNAVQLIKNDFFQIRLKEVVYKYKDKYNNETFTIGPLDYCFNSGEIIFITGGNGSGKSTLAKIITGLYYPDSGEITLNGNNINSKTLKNQYSVIFSDFHLFEKLYGIDYKDKSQQINDYLKVVGLNGKVEVNDGQFSTIKLSTGQRKRLALLNCHFEDCPIFLFDEWAAEQDSEFKKKFYLEVLPELKKRGKCIIVITHDEDYFHIGDKVIKMDMGMIVSNNATIA